MTGLGSFAPRAEVEQSPMEAQEGEFEGKEWERRKGEEELKVGKTDGNSNDRRKTHRR